MNPKFTLNVVALIATYFIAGCTQGPSPEARARDYNEQADAAKRQAEFRKGLPPAPDEAPAR